MLGSEHRKLHPLATHMRCPITTSFSPKENDHLLAMHFEALSEIYHRIAAERYSKAFLGPASLPNPSIEL